MEYFIIVCKFSNYKVECLNVKFMVYFSVMGGGLHNGDAIHRSSNGCGFLHG